MTYSCYRYILSATHIRNNTSKGQAMPTLDEYRQAELNRNRFDGTIPAPEYRYGLWFIYCPNCQCGFFAKRKDAKTCSAECRQAVYRKRKADRERYSEDKKRTRCACGQTVPTSPRGRKRKHCSAACKQLAYTMRKEKNLRRG